MGFFKILFVFVLVGCQLATYGKTVEKIVAIVNSEIITLSDMEKYKDKLEKGGLIENTLLKYTESDELVESKKKLLNHLINERLVDTEAKKTGIEITIERVESEIRDIASKRGLTRDQLKAALKNQGVRFSDYQDFVKRGLERHALISKEVSSKIKISDDDVASYYIQSSKNKNSLVFKYKLAQIFFKADGNAKSKADDVLSKLKVSKKFEDLAAQYSEDPNFNQGGLLGEFNAGELLPEMEQSIRNLKEGQHSQVVKTKLGFHILKVLKKTLVPDPKLEEQKNFIRQRLFTEAFDRNIKSWLKQLRNQAYIHLN